MIADLGRAAGAASARIARPRRSRVMSSLATRLAPPSQRLARSRAADLRLARALRSRPACAREAAPAHHRHLPPVALRAPPRAARTPPDSRARPRGGAVTSSFSVPSATPAPRSPLRRAPGCTRTASMHRSPHPNRHVAQRARPGTCADEPDREHRDERREVDPASIASGTAAGSGCTPCPRRDRGTSRSDCSGSGRTHDRTALMKITISSDLQQHVEHRSDRVQQVADHEHRTPPPLSRAARTAPCPTRTMRAAFFDRDLEVAAHPHRQLGQRDPQRRAGPVAQLARRARTQRRAVLRALDPAAPIDISPSSSSPGAGRPRRAASRARVGSDPVLARLSAHVHLHQHPQPPPARPLRRATAPRASSSRSIAVDPIEQLRRPRPPCCAADDRSCASGPRVATDRGDLRLGFLHPVLAEIRERRDPPPRAPPRAARVFDHSDQADPIGSSSRALRARSAIRSRISSETVSQSGEAAFTERARLVARLRAAASGKRRAESRQSAASRTVEALRAACGRGPVGYRMVEAAGIEPASESRSPESPTGVSGRLDLARLRSDRRDRWRASPIEISSSAPERELWTSLRLSDARTGPHRRGPGDRRC